jgi:hypothetical protein
MYHKVSFNTLTNILREQPHRMSDLISPTSRDMRRTTGILICVQGFLPDAADQFVQDYVFKAFTPSILIFLLCSTLYGLWKSRQEDGK